MVESFVMHPDWPAMLDFIEAHFNNSVDIQEINIDNPSTTVHAEVIAKQSVDNDIKTLRNTFTSLRKSYSKSKQTYE